MPDSGSSFKMFDSHGEFTLDTSDFVRGLSEVQRQQDAFVRQTATASQEIERNVAQGLQRIVDSRHGLIQFEESAASIPERIIQPLRALEGQQGRVASSMERMTSASASAPSVFNALDEAIRGSIRGMEGMDKSTKNIIGGLAEVGTAAAMGGLIGGGIGAAATAATSSIQVMFRAWADGAEQARRTTEEALQALMEVSRLENNARLTATAGAGTSGDEALQVQLKILGDRRRQMELAEKAEAAGEGSAATQRDAVGREAGRTQDMAFAQLQEMLRAAQQTTGDARTQNFERLIETLSTWFTSNEGALQAAAVQFAADRQGIGNRDGRESIDDFMARLQQALVDEMRQLRSEASRSQADADTQRVEQDFDRRKAEIEAVKQKDLEKKLQPKIDQFFEALKDFADGAREKAIQIFEEEHKTVRNVVTGFGPTARPIDNFGGGARDAFTGRTGFVGFEEAGRFIQDQIDGQMTDSDRAMIEAAELLREQVDQARRTNELLERNSRSTIRTQ